MFFATGLKPISTKVLHVVIGEQVDKHIRIQIKMVIVSWKVF